LSNSDTKQPVLKVNQWKDGLANKGMKINKQQKARITALNPG